MDRTLLSGFYESWTPPVMDWMSSEAAGAPWMTTDGRTMIPDQMTTLDPLAVAQLGVASTDSTQRDLRSSCGLFNNTLSKDCTDIPDFDLEISNFYHPDQDWLDILSNPDLPCPPALDQGAQLVTSIPDQLSSVEIDSLLQTNTFDSLNPEQAFLGTLSADKSLLGSLPGEFDSYLSGSPTDELSPDLFADQPPESLLEFLNQPPADSPPVVPSPTDTACSNESDFFFPDLFLSSDPDHLDLKSILGDLSHLIEATPPCDFAQHDHSYASQQRDQSGPSSHVKSSAEKKPEQPKMSAKEKYQERRRKNNLASKRSRSTRKEKFVTREMEAEELQKDNEELKVRIQQLEAVCKVMKDTLFQKLVGGGSMPQQSSGEQV